MGDVLDFKQKPNDKFEYFESETGLSIRDSEKTIEIIKALYTSNCFILSANNESMMFRNREDLAEFLWAAAIFLDSEERFKPSGKLVGLNYE